MTKAEQFLDWLNGPGGGGSTERPHHVVDFAQSLDDDEGDVFWKVIMDAWSGFDLIPHEEFQFFFEHFDPDHPPRGAPRFLTVYRGQDLDEPVGLSWTTDRAVAESFARGHRGIRHENPVVIEAKVHTCMVAFTCDDRGESEVVLNADPDGVDPSLPYVKDMRMTFLKRALPSKVPNVD